MIAQKVQVKAKGWAWGSSKLEEQNTLASGGGGILMGARGGGTRTNRFTSDIICTRRAEPDGEC